MKPKPTIREAIFNRLPTHMKTRDWILGEIAYEKNKGVHTYHFCDCGKYCRSSMCAKCWKKLLKYTKSKS